jgi:hypothetical protein
VFFFSVCSFRVVSFELNVMSRAILITLALVLALSMCAEARPSRLQKKSVLGKGHNGGNGNESWDYLLLVQRYIHAVFDASRSFFALFDRTEVNTVWPALSDGLELSATSPDATRTHTITYILQLLIT